jgi:uroporphyrinogen-III synthase
MGMARQSDPSHPSGPGIPVLVTRPRDQGETFAQKLTARFGARIRPLIAPLMAPEYLAPALPEGPFDAVIFTSAHGVEGARRLGVPLPRLAWCVGRSTAAKATAAGFETRSSDGDASDLVAALLAAPERGRFLYIRGVDTVGDVENALISQGISTLSLQVYLQRAIPLEEEARALLCQSDPVLVPLFSPRSAQLFADALPADTRASFLIAAMSEAVATAAARLPRQTLVTAARPDAEAMLDAVETLLAATPLP